MRMLRTLTLYFAFLAFICVPHGVAGQSPSPGPASDSMSVRVVLQAVLEKLAPYSAAVAVRADSQAWSIVTPPAGPVWERVHVWLVQLLHPRAFVAGSKSGIRLVQITSAIVRGDSLFSRFTIGTTFPEAHRSPSTVYELSAKWIGTGWSRPQVCAVLDVD